MKPGVLTALLLFPLLIFAQNDLNFDDYFINATLRVDFYHIGDSQSEIITLDKVYRQGVWAGSISQLLDPFGYGSYRIKVYDVASNRLIYSRGFASYFGEYRTTSPAMAGINHTFHESALAPFPRHSIQLVIEKRDRNNIWHPLFTQEINPADYHLNNEPSAPGDEIIEMVKNGDPHKKVDLVFLSEGYTQKEHNKFKEDLQKYVDELFGWEPYKSHQLDFNISGVYRASPESGVDQPRRGSYKNSNLDATFNSMDSDRYLLTEDNRDMRDMACRVPYDVILIVANIKRYGGGGIYNDYCIFTSDGPWNEYVFQHEFGHTFAGLADEYYTSDVAYSDFYPRGVEPTEPNITALLDPVHVKWQQFLTPGIAVPTDWGKQKYDSLTLAFQKINGRKDSLTIAWRINGVPESRIDSLRSTLTGQGKAISDQISQFNEKNPSRGEVGAFEGAGYASEGLYRPSFNCIMNRFDKKDKHFCPVCRNAIEQMIEYYAN